jgi:hypothetical protein
MRCCARARATKSSTQSNSIAYLDFRSGRAPASTQDVALPVRHAPDIDVVAPLHIAHEVRILLQWPGAQTRKIQLSSGARVHRGGDRGLRYEQAEQALGEEVDANLFSFICGGAQLNSAIARSF